MQLQDPSRCGPFYVACLFIQDISFKAMATTWPKVWTCEFLVPINLVDSNSFPNSFQELYKKYYSAMEHAEKVLTGADQDDWVLEKALL